jgi:hypothetical protein
VHVWIPGIEEADSSDVGMLGFAGSWPEPLLRRNYNRGILFRKSGNELRPLLWSTREPGKVLLSGIKMCVSWLDDHRLSIEVHPTSKILASLERYYVRSRSLERGGRTYQLHLRQPV